jgi:hypothetical protein
VRAQQESCAWCVPAHRTIMIHNMTYAISLDEQIVRSYVYVILHILSGASFC